MQALGYLEGRNISFDVRHADGKADRLPALAAELVAQRPAVIATFGDATGLAVKAAPPQSRLCLCRKTWCGPTSLPICETRVQHYRRKRHGHRA